MINRLVFWLLAIVSQLMFLVGCDADSSSTIDPYAAHVGETCPPHAAFNPENLGDLAETTFSFYVEAPECAVEGVTSVCMTQVEPDDEAEYGNSYDIYCSCRCADGEGNDHTVNNDLCECPEDAVCLEIIPPDVEGVPAEIEGSYCIPECLASECGTGCVPPASGESSWEWTCAD